MTQQSKGSAATNAGRPLGLIPRDTSPTAEYLPILRERIASERAVRTEYPTRSSPRKNTRTSRIRRLEYRISADCGLLLHDGDEGDFGPDDWTERDKARLFALGATWADLMTPSSTDLSLVVERRDTPPGDEDLLAWDHVAEFSLAAPSGRLEIATACLARPLAIRVPPDTYRIRVCYGNLGAVYQEDGLPRGGPLRYRLALWPRDRADVVILKQWAGRFYA